jgi:hypothetical protein
LVNRYMWDIDGVPKNDKERMLNQIDGLIASVPPSDGSSNDWKRKNNCSNPPASFLS